MQNFITDYVTKHASAVDVLVSTFALITLLIVKKYLKPLKEQLTTSNTMREEDGNPTIKDIMIENYRETSRIRQRQENYESNQEALTSLIGGIQTEVRALNNKLENHIKENEPIMNDIKNHLKSAVH